MEWEQVDGQRDQLKEQVMDATPVVELGIEKSYDVQTEVLEPSLVPFMRRVIIKPRNVSARRIDYLLARFDMVGQSKKRVWEDSVVTANSNYKRVKKKVVCIFLDIFGYEKMSPVLL